jgi:diaminohydroxyphosphoribosylaminopyrimidine deaminase / 5-amino-6-(5-phosphoribosylamino)uracil reductase
MLRLFSDASSRVADPYLARAIQLASRGAGSAWPNPVVGCVIVRDGSIVGEGFHPRAGLPHAEVFALADAGDLALGADAYVTLEPCAHHGKTPPCTDALLAAGVRRVVIGMRDPNHDAAGGAEVLKDAGVIVEFAEDPAPFAEINSGWLKRLAIGLPRVNVKVGSTLDGKLAFEPGMRASITGPSGAVVTRRLRAACDAVCVSASTVIADDPALTVRDAPGVRAERQPLRIVLVRDTLPPADAKVFTDGGAPTLILASSLASEEGLGRLHASAGVLRWEATEGFAGAWRALAAHGIGELLVEAGPRLLTAILAEEALDELTVVSAGGMGGPVASGLFLGESDRHGEALSPRFSPAEAGIVSDVSVTVWSASARSHAE